MVTGQTSENFAVALAVRQHQLISGVLPSLGGQDEGPNPHELLEAALAACTSMTVQMYATRKQFPLQAIHVSVQITKEGATPQMTCDLQLVGNLSEDQRARLLEIAGKCPVHKLLTGSVQIENRLTPSTES